ncbi:hypothetical protein LOK49_LG01G04067 [Camellia lanceoleosa]|uniref:Uncharacterized protein n=1 Tax=Camellia lanceoleosa TaxID=1840588 RepID=A0ACC0J0K3_9ERIC|nr:hypothetical protein LOK49_LG01G04067 [Camellia lanceoleosa]
MFRKHEALVSHRTKPKPVKTTSVSEKEKQPVKATGGKLAGFLNSVFRNGNSKKMKKNSSSSSTGGYGDARGEKSKVHSSIYAFMGIFIFLYKTSMNLKSGTSSNVLQLKRLRETLFAALIFQDLSFFDKEAVGDLTSRLGADCQRMSHVIENDMHLILCSSLRVATLIVQAMAGQVSLYRHLRKCCLWILVSEFQHSVSFNTGFSCPVRRNVDSDWSCIS